jgi:DNA (cytosine-5)-methyltransferase 1
MQSNTPIKTRKAKVSPRGVYLEDKELLLTQFLVGTKFIVNCWDNEVTFAVHEDGKHTVSKRMMKGVLRPVLDVVKQEVKDTIKNFTELEINIYDEHITIAGVK